MGIMCMKCSNVDFTVTKCDKCPKCGNNDKDTLLEVKPEFFVSADDYNG